MNLFEIAAGYRSMAERLADLDLDDQTIADTLEAEGGELVTKGTNVAFVCRNLEATAAAIKEAEAQMAARRKALESRAARLRKHLLDGMRLANIQRIDSPHFSITIKKNPPSVDVFEPGLVPKEYMTDPPPPPPQIDKDLIKKAIKDGFEVPGCRLTQGERVDIR
jgi:hypothetical protein